MTPETAKQLRDNPKFQAFSDGKQMQWHSEFSQTWIDAGNLELKDFLERSDRIRIKPEPRETFLVVSKVLASLPGYRDKEQAERAVQLYGTSDVEILHMREVL